MNIEELIKQKNVSCCGLADNSIPDWVLKKDKGSVQIFSLENSSNISINNRIFVFKKKWNLLDVRKQSSEACFIDNKALKSLFAKFPSGSQFIFVRFMPRSSWLVAFPGLLRLIVKKRVAIAGIKKLKTGNSFTRWIILKNNRVRPSRERPSLSEEVGIQGFLDFLRNEKVNYAVLRFFESLPKLHRPDGDLDILVSDEDEHKVKYFLSKNPGLIRVDIWSVSCKFDETVYYPPLLKRKILETAVDGPAGSRVPAPKEYFLSLAYHALYHKGFDAGISSHLLGVEVAKTTDNDYIGTLARTARELGLDIKLTMENIDDYLYHQGWRPKTDTLANKARENIWIQKRFFSNECNQNSEIGLGVFIIKQKAFQDSVAESILREITRDGKFIILRTKEIIGEDQRRIADQLRSGFWTDSSDKDKLDNYLPAMAVIVINLHLLHCSKSNTRGMAPKEEMRHLKSKIRRIFDKNKTSLVHSTDTSDEGWEYIDVCFPGKTPEIKEEIRSINNGLRLPLSERLKLTLARMSYRWKMYKWNLRRFIVDKIINQNN